MNIKYLVIDVDGTMTDGGIYYDENGNETKKFCCKDAAGFFAARYYGIKVIVLTGRECNATKRRMEELKVDYIFQNIKNKVSFLKNFIEANHILSSEIAYIGDDLNDLSSMKLCDHVGCPADSCKEVQAISNYVSNVCGGHGAVRDIVENMIFSKEEWQNAVTHVYDSSI